MNSSDLDRNDREGPFTFNITTGQEDNESAEFRKSHENTPTHNGLESIRNSIGNSGFAEMIKSIGVSQGSFNLPRFNTFQTVSFDINDTMFQSLPLER